MNEITNPSRKPQSARANALAMQFGLTPLPLIHAPGSRLAWAVCLLPSARLQRLVLHIGMLDMADVLRQTIHAQTVAQLRDALGRELYEFGMTRAPLIASVVPSRAVSRTQVAPAEWLQALRDLGMQALLHVFKAHAVDLMPLLSRFVTLPLMEPADVAQSSEEATQATLFTRRVLREIEPVWCQSFELDKRKT